MFFSQEIDVCNCTFFTPSLLGAMYLLEAIHTPLLTLETLYIDGHAHFLTTKQKLKIPGKGIEEFQLFRSLLIFFGVSAFIFSIEVIKGGFNERRLRGLLFQAFLLFCRLLITFDFEKKLFINYLLSDGSNKVEVEVNKWKEHDGLS